MERNGYIHSVPFGQNGDFLTGTVLLGLVNVKSKGLTKQSWFIYFPGAKPVHIHCFTVLLLQPAHIPMYVYVLSCPGSSVGRVLT